MGKVMEKFPNFPIFHKILFFFHSTSKFSVFQPPIFHLSVQIRHLINRINLTEFLLHSALIEEPKLGQVGLSKRIRDYLGESRLELKSMT